MNDTKDCFRDNVQLHLHELYTELDKRYQLQSCSGAKTFLSEEQGIDSLLISKIASNGLSREAFLNLLTSSEGNIIGPLPHQDLSKEISNYFISSSHNTYLTGNQLSSDSSTSGYRDFLLRGCRCVEIDVWDGDEDSQESSEDEIRNKQVESGISGFEKNENVKNASPIDVRSVDGLLGKNTATPPSVSKKALRTPEPRVLHGYTATKDISFRSVCESIRDYAFVSSELPLVVSLEVHASFEQQEKMVQIIKECWEGMLVNLTPLPVDGLNIALPAPKNVVKKILIKVKQPPHERAMEQKIASLDLSDDDQNHETGALSFSSSETSPNRALSSQASLSKGKKVAEVLSELGIYTKGYSFKGFDQPEARIPAHIFSISETALLDMCKVNPSPLFEHNRVCSILGLRFSSSNFNPLPFWRAGVQIVALNWQKCDAGTMINEAMFADSGGWILKPSPMRDCKEIHRDSNMYQALDLSLEIKFIASIDISMLSTKGDRKEHRNNSLYVKCYLHTTTCEGHYASLSKNHKQKLKTKTVKGAYPSFDYEKIQFAKVKNVILELSFLRLISSIYCANMLKRFKVMSDVFGRDDLVAWACFRLDRLRAGFRLLHLLDPNGERTSETILVHVSKTLEQGELLESQHGSEDGA